MRLHIQPLSRHLSSRPGGFGSASKLAAAIGMQAALGAVFCWPVFQSPLSALPGWNATAALAPFWYSLLFFLAGCVAASCLLPRLGGRLLGLAGGALVALGYGLGAVQTESWSAVLTGCGVMAGFGAGLAFWTPMGLAASVFPERRRAVGIALAGSFACGSLVLLPFGDAIAAATRAAGGVSPLLGGLAALWLIAICGGSLCHPIHSVAAAAPDRAELKRMSAIAIAIARRWFQWSAFFIGISVGALAIREQFPGLPLPGDGTLWTSVGFVCGAVLLSNLLGLWLWKKATATMGRGLAILLFLAVTGLAAFGAGADQGLFGSWLAAMTVAGFGFGALLAAMPMLQRQMLPRGQFIGTFGLLFPAYGLSSYLPRISMKVSAAAFADQIVLTVGAMLLMGFLYLIVRPADAKNPVDAA